MFGVDEDPSLFQFESVADVLKACMAIPLVAKLNCLPSSCYDVEESDELCLKVYEENADT